MEILFIRHGESEADILNVHEGRADYSLTKLGTSQAKCLAEYLKKEKEIDVIWSSTLKRAKETATILGEYLNCKVIYDDNLKERDNGILAGKPITEENKDSHYTLKPFECIEEGETDLDFRARAESVLLRILDMYKDSNRIAIVSHGGMIEKLIHSMLKLPTVPNAYFYTNDTGVHSLEYHKDYTIIKYLNKTDHLLI
ncbi:histidine phosphatase family protein [Bacillus cereus]